MPTDADLEAWMQAVASAADRQAFAALFKHFAPRVKAYLERCGSPPQQAEELAQEAMVLLWRRAATFDPQRARVSTWLFTIARNLRIDQHRRLGGAAAVAIAGDVDDEALQLPDDTALPPEEAAQAAQRERGVRRALAELPQEQAAVLRLAYYEDESHARIAQQLGLPLGTVKSRIRLAVAQLRRKLDAFAP